MARLNESNKGIPLEQRNKDMDEFITKVRSMAVEIWEDVKDRMTNPDRNGSPYICPNLLDAMRDSMGDDMVTVDRITRMMGRSWELTTVLVTMSFPEFPEKYDPFGVITTKTHRRYGWFGKPDEESTAKRIQVVDEMIELYKFLKEQGTLC